MNYICVCVFMFCVSIFFFLFYKKKKRGQHHCTPPILSDWDIRFMAYHEAGHAVCSYFLPEREKLILITIDPSSEAFGMIKTEIRAQYNETRTSLSSMIATLLAGRLSEEIFLKTQTTSCIHDLDSVQRIAADMVLKFGMGKTAGLSALKKTENTCCSEYHAKQICADIQQIIKEAENDAREILQKKQMLVVALAEKLIIQKTLTANEISRFFEQQKENIEHE